MKIKRNKLKREKNLKIWKKQNGSEKENNQGEIKDEIKNLKSQELKETDEKVLSSEEIRELAMKFALNPEKGQANTWLNLPSQQSKKFLF